MNNSEEASKKIESLTLENFTVFKKATLDFCPGINVLIGENSTGKTHVLKAIYSFLKTGPEKKRAYGTVLYVSESEYANYVHTLAYLLKLKSIFNTDLKNVVRFPEQAREIHLELNVKLLATEPFSLKIFPIFEHREQQGEAKFNFKGSGRIADNISSLYIPADDFLSKNEGFISLYERREIPYSSLYQDLALDLNSLPLREEHLTEVQPILDNLQSIIAGEEWKKADFIKQENGRFYFELPEGKLDVHLMADGYRKFGMLWYLLRNGSISKNSVLFWDEPETSLNPKLIRELVKILQQLAAIGVQIFIATHDYLLSYELSLLNEYSKNDQVDIKFFSLHKPSRNAGVVVEAASTLSEISHNPILEAYSAHYDHEAELFYNAGATS
ncbi:MAG: AAA family ATPase [Thiotrichaceae bacterium]